MTPTIDNVSIVINGIVVPCVTLAHYATTVPAIRDEVIRRLVEDGFVAPLPDDVPTAKVPVVEGAT